MRTLADQEFESHRDLSSERIHVHGGSITLGAAAAQSIAMIFHELMTNAVKHGALTMQGGQVEVRWHCDEAGRLCFTWAETGGPTIATPLRQGFGMTLIERTICDQLDGQVRFDWRRKGLVCWFRIPATAGSQTQFGCEAEAMA
jgi:two-component sensor histidine kinase